MGRNLLVAFAVLAGAVLGALVFASGLGSIRPDLGLWGAVTLLVVTAFAGSWLLGTLAERTLAACSSGPSGSGAVMAPGRWGFWVAAACGVLAPVGFVVWLYVAFASGGG